MRVHVAIEGARARVVVGNTDTKLFRRQWSEFLAALVAKRVGACAGSPWLTSAELNAVGRWMYKRRESVGKEVSRYLTRLDAAGLGGLVVTERRTREWRIGVPPSRIVVRPDGEALVDWLHAVGWREGGADKDLSEREIGWIVCATRALIGIYIGDVETAAIEANASLAFADSRLQRAVSVFLEERAQARVDDYAGLEARWRGSGSTAGPWQQAIAARSATLRARYLGSPDFQTLAAMLPGLEDAGDLATIGYVHNTLGVVARRDNRARLACVHLSRAIPMLVLSGAMHDLQSTVFNLGHALWILARDSVTPTSWSLERMPLRGAIALLELDVEIRSRLRIGFDSAQAEILLAIGYLWGGKVPEADALLEEAERIAERLSDDYEQACFHYGRACFASLRQVRDGVKLASTLQEVDRDLRIAAKLFGRTGHPSSHIDTLLRDVRRGEIPRRWRLYVGGQHALDSDER